MCSKSAASLTILAFMFFCSSLLCFLIPFSCAFDTLAHILAAVQHVARSVMACRWVGLLQSCDKQITEQINESKPEGAVFDLDMHTVCKNGMENSGLKW